MKAIDVANELKKLIASLESNPELDIKKPYVFFTTCDTKDQLQNLARIMPRPLKKSLKGAGGAYPKIELEYDGEALQVSASIYQSTTCRLISEAIPAKYECDPILSPEEDAELEASL